MSYSIGVVCSVGVGPARGGRARNEDNYLICRDGRVTFLDGGAERVEPGGGEGVLLAVCDGMGGHEDGDVASATAVRVLGRLYRPGAPRDASRALLKYIGESHLRLHHKALERGKVTMGTTLTAAWLLDGQAAWAQVGDSRLYLLRRGELRQISSDQTRNEFLRRDGRKPIAEGDHLAQSFIYGSRGLGDNSRLRLERGRDCGLVPLEPGDRLLLCSDGLCGFVDDVSIHDVLSHTPDPQAAAVACSERAIARGSTDNVTVMVVRVDAVDRPPAEDEGWEVDEDETIVL